MKAITPCQILVGVVLESEGLIFPCFVKKMTIYYIFGRQKHTYKLPKVKTKVFSHHHQWNH